MPPPPTVIPISARSPPTMTHVCAHTNAQARSSHPLLEGDQKCFGSHLCQQSCCCKDSPLSSSSALLPCPRSATVSRGN
ncbi:hypothetical protein EYF80_017115 [Liparis tanakae]|uniref:Uncharacterized protein n=1 Tax=Liparis tanakae TaxID=230148 RepID=A0A4Z2I3L6_9TELE|nr:hypothetical protein EYF80_017115 [Liparis tanakae]